MELGDSVEVISENILDSSPYKNGTIVAILKDAAVVLFENASKKTVPLSLLRLKDSEINSNYDYSEEEEEIEELGDINPHPWF